MDAVSERLQQLNDEKAELIHELSQKNRSVQEAEVAIADCRAEQEKYQKSAKEIIEELRSQYVEAMQEQATVGNELKYLERQYQQESAKNQTAVTKQTELSTAIKRKATAAEIVNERLQAVQQQLDEQRKQYIHLQEKAKDNKRKI